MGDINKLSKRYNPGIPKDIIKGHNSYYIEEDNKIPKDEPCCRDGWDCYYFNNGGCKQGHKKNA